MHRVQDPNNMTHKVVVKARIKILLCGLGAVFFVECCIRS
jgi:hypothetical protein